jgi:geranylgeranyl diphosphate synthase type I
MEQQARSFAAQLAQYKHLIDVDIAAYAEHVATSTRTHYGPYASDVTSVFLDVLGRGGKRIRGALAMVGYEMCGGRDRQMIARAATALEMINAYILMVDDVQDRSAMRRGKPSAHEMLAQYHRGHHLQGDAAHTGVSLALNAALAGNHAAQMLLSGLNVDAELRMKAVGIINQAMMVTAHGQTLDIMNELVVEPVLEDLEHVLEWKTAYYTFLNPLCVGMVLAGAGCEDTDAIRDYALNTGCAFQITDDIIGIFGDDKQTGKSAMDDIREGKQTILTHYTFAHASAGDAAFLRSMLGNEQLTLGEFARCKTIIETSGALDNARTQAKDHVAEALASLDAYGARWSDSGVLFLRELAASLLDRTA